MLLLCSATRPDAARYAASARVTVSLVIDKRKEPRTPRGAGLFSGIPNATERGPVALTDSAGGGASRRRSSVALLRYRFRSVATRQHLRVLIAQHNQAPGIFLDFRLEHRPCDSEVQVLIEHLLDAGAFAVLRRTG